LALRLDAAINLAGAELYLDRFSECGVHAERVVAVARSTGQPAVALFGFMLLAWARMLGGELADASRCSTAPSRRHGCSATRRASPGSS
jgi:predicted ATPase